MIKPEDIPPEAWNATLSVWTGYNLRSAIVAAINAWPGGEHIPGARVTDTYTDPGKIILPLPQKDGDA